MLSLWIFCASFLVSTSSFVATFPMKQQLVRQETNKIDPQNLALLMTQALLQRANELEEQIASSSYNVSVQRIHQMNVPVTWLPLQEPDDMSALHYKRSPFSAWGGKRSQGSKFSAWGGKRSGSAFSAWGGKR